MNKKTIAAALSTALLGLGLSTAASAAVSQGNLTFTFSGNIPALPVSGSGWGFVNADGTPYTAPSSITLNATDTADGIRLTSSSEEFYVKAADSGTFAANSKITALLVSQPTVSGTAVNPSKLNTVTTSVTLNGKVVPLGSAPVDVITIGGAVDGSAQRMTLGAQVDVPTDARSQSGGDIRVTAAIRMSANIS